MERGSWRIFAGAVGLSATLAVIVAALIVRACLGTGFKFNLSPASILCGDMSAKTGNAFRRIAPNEMSVMSAVAEREDLSIEAGRGADKLIDGSEKTLAEPGSSTLDYRISLLEPYEIKQIVIHWGDYGINPNYVASWSLESSEDGFAWAIVASGESPRDSKTAVNERFTTSRLRLRADSAKDWIGAYEIQIIGKPIE